MRIDKSKWRKSKLPEIVWFQEGPGVRKSQYTETGIKLFNVANLVDGKIDLSTSDRYISEDEAYGRYAHFMADEGDLVIASSGIKVEYFEKKMGFVKKEHLPICMNTSTIRFKTLNKEILDIKYFMYFLKSDNFKIQLARLITGAAQLNFGPSHIKQMFAPVPMLNEQKIIASELDAIQAMIDGYREQLADLDALAQSIFLETFGDPISNPKGWEMLPLSYFGKIITGSTPSTKDSENYSSDDFPFVKPSDLSEELRYIGNTEFYISSKAHNNARILPKGTVMVTCIGVIGKIGVAKTECSSNQQINSIIINPDNNNMYVAYAIIGIRNLMKKKANGPVVPLINKTQFSQFNIPSPPLELQQQFAGQVEAIKKQKELLRQQIDDAETLMAERMQYYFS